MAGAVQSWQGAFLLGAAAKNVTLITSSSFPAVHTALAWMLGLFSLGMGLWRAGRGQQGMGREGTAGNGQGRDSRTGAGQEGTAQGWDSRSCRLEKPSETSSPTSPARATAAPVPRCHRAFKALQGWGLSLSWAGGTHKDGVQAWLCSGLPQNLVPAGAALITCSEELPHTRETLPSDNYFHLI